MQNDLREKLDTLYNRFDRSFLSPDPLECVPEKGSVKNRECSAFIAATFAYGRADLIVRNVNAILKELGKKPLNTLLSGDYKKLFKGFAYRFHKRPDLLWLMERLAEIYKTGRSLEKTFVASGHNHAERLENFSRILRGKGNLSQARSSLLPLPSAGSACKRMNLFLRWMVRTDDVDLGLWSKVSPADLIIPLDVHVHRIATRIGLVSPGTANFKKALELTETLKSFDPDDPVKYDFAICSLGKLGHCGKSVIYAKCSSCILKEHCTDKL